MRTRVYISMPLMALVFSLCALAAVRAQVQGDDPELKKFQGTWVLVSGEMGGTKVSEQHVKQSRITFSGNKVEVITPHQHKDTIHAIVMKLDTAKNPKEMQWVRSSGPNTGVTMTAIYEFEGPDTYRICFDPAGTAAPGAFATKKGSGHIWQTWKKAKQ